MGASLTVHAGDAPQRLDVFITGALEDCTRAQVQKAIRDGQCLVDGNVETSPSRKLRPGQRVAVTIPRGQNELQARGEPLPVLWQDEFLAAVVKPAGVTVHPCPSCQEETIAHRLLTQFPSLAAQGGERPGIVHRLDKNTSGVMLIALTERTRRLLARAFAAREVEKKYLALAFGHPPAQGECVEPIGRHPTLKTRMAVVPENRGGRSARTRWRKLWQGEDCALLEVNIGTGRTHQIRVHMAHLGWPLLGDGIYASAQVAALAPRQMLHAWQIALAHPLSGKRLRFCVEPPEDFLACAEIQAQKMLPIVVTGNEGSGKSSFCRELARWGVPTISADAIVADLYAGRSAATDWIATYVGEEAITASGAVDKGVLFQILQARPQLRPELEKAVHGLVAEAIGKFWRAHAGDPCACAEIPLYFESSLPAMFQPKPLVVGISCPEKVRLQRLAEDRGWNEEKIATMESWQMPEDQKMNRCDVVIANDAGHDTLRQRAARFVQTEIAGRRLRREQYLRGLCSCPPLTPPTGAAT